jgi:hypothetical protein
LLREDPEKWLTKLESKSIDQLKTVMPFVGEQGILLKFAGQTKVPVVAFFTGDASRTNKLLSFLRGWYCRRRGALTLPKFVTLNRHYSCASVFPDRLKGKCLFDNSELVESQMRQLETNLFEFTQDETLDPCFVFFAIGYAKAGEGMSA